MSTKTIKNINSNSFSNSKRIGYLIKVIQHEIRKRMDSGLENVSLTTPQYAVLCQLEEFPGLSNADLAKKSFITPQTMNQIIFGLEKEKLIIRSNHLTNRRIQQTNLTNKGKILLKKAHQIVNDIESSLYERLTDDEKEILTNYLEKIRNDV